MHDLEEQIIIRRHPYEEPHNLQLEFRLSNKSFAATIDIYLTTEQLKKIGAELARFPKKIGDEFVFEYGSENPDDRFYRHFVLRAYTTGAAGHCALQFKINLNQKPPAEGIGVFSLQAEPAAISRLGDLLLSFAALQHRELHWTPRGDAELLV